jgi:hypothetical protein
VKRNSVLEAKPCQRHALCEKCFAARNPGVEPKRIAHWKARAFRVPCCECGTATDSNIVIKAEPWLVNCRGLAGIHQKAAA